jgi:hypothetical protein
LKIKKPKSAPVTANAKIANDVWSYTSAITPNALKAIDAVPETSPSSPSVKLIAFEKPTNQKIINATYATPKSIDQSVKGIAKEVKAGPGFNKKKAAIAKMI